MNSEPFGTTIFCDDIRHEMNGKITLVGCYSNELNFNGPAPGILPTFAAYISVKIPTEIKFDQIVLRVVKKDGDEETEILKSEIVLDEVQKRQAYGSGDTAEHDHKVFSLNAPSKWTQLIFNKSGEIRVRADLDGRHEIRLGTLKVNFKTEDVK